jgi:DNA-binding Xre family transcriptional regulator
LRHEKKWTIEELAAQAGVDIKQIYRIKRGKPVMTTTITRIAAALRCPPGDLIHATPPLGCQR